MTGKAPTYLFTHPMDMKDLWVSNAHKLNKHGHAYDALRGVFGRGLIPIETGPEWKANQRVVGKHMQPKNLPNLDSDTQVFLEQMIERENPERAKDFVLKNVNESLISLNFQLTAKSFFGREATVAEAQAVSEDIHTVNQFLLANAVMYGLPNALYQRTPLFLGKVHKAEQSFKKYAQEIVTASTPLTGYMKAILDAGPEGTGQMDLAAQRDEVILAIISSYVSTATAAGWALSFISQPQFAHFQETIRAEAEENTIVKPGSVTSMIIKEGLRLYPPVFIMTRKATDDIHLENELGSIVVPKGSSVFVSPYITHRNETYWDKPGEFQPLRFQGTYSEQAYLPFGLGERKCIGEHYTTRVACMTLGHILQKYKLEMLQPPQPMFRATLHPSHDFAVRVTQR